MEHSLLEKPTATRLAKKVPAFYRIWKVRYHVHKSTPLLLILCQMHSVHAISLTSILILTSHLWLGLPSGLFPSSIPTNISYKLLISTTHATYATNLILPDLTGLIICSIQVMSLFIMHAVFFSLPPLLPS